MTYKYLEHHSRIIDFFEIPSLYLKDTRNEDRSNRERQILADVLADKEALFQEVEPIKAKLKEFVLFGQYYALPTQLYFHSLDLGHDPKTPVEALQFFKQLTVDDLETCLRSSLYRDYLSKEEHDLPLLDLLDLVNLPADESWYWYRAIKEPSRHLEGLIEVMAELVTIYQPYYDRYEVERQAYLETFDLDEFMSKLPMTGQDIAQEYGREYELILLSPMHQTLAFLMEEKYELPIFVTVTPRVEEFVFYQPGLELDTLVTLLKLISDESRYQVLQALTQPHAKNKDIAQKLGITTAAVSFHTQKLINSQLVLFDSENSNQKFKVNKPLLKEMIEKLQEDFDLEN